MGQWLHMRGRRPVNQSPPSLLVNDLSSVVLSNRLGRHFVGGDASLLL